MSTIQQYYKWKKMNYLLHIEFIMKAVKNLLKLVNTLDGVINLKC